MGINSEVSPFHLAIPVWNLETCRKFYTEIIGCKEGRSCDNWVDLNLFGHQLVLHYKPREDSNTHCNEVDGKHVPVPHFGVIMDWNVFEDFSKKLKLKKINFIIEPYVRFKGKVGEQATMFFLDPSGNALEFKSFRDFNQIFAK
jgi:extradiol dioxygenase family protein